MSSAGRSGLSWLDEDWKTRLSRRAFLSSANAWAAVVLKDHSSEQVEALYSQLDEAFRACAEALEAAAPERCGPGVGVYSPTRLPWGPIAGRPLDAVDLLVSGAPEIRENVSRLIDRHRMPVLLAVLILKGISADIPGLGLAEVDGDESVGPPERLVFRAHAELLRHVYDELVSAYNEYERAVRALLSETPAADRRAVEKAHRRLTQLGGKARHRKSSEVKLLILKWDSEEPPTKKPASARARRFANRLTPEQRQAFTSENPENTICKWLRDVRKASKPASN